ncbi:MAG: alpha/beta hydrolase [Rhodocyclaceae bacterium]|nr:alpha/beta hydrolase [Rhodocyclaceae bacterium]
MESTIAGHPSYIYTGGKPLDPALPARAPAIVFIHGAAQDHSCWSQQSRWFAHHGHATLAPDLPGHGRSGGAPLATVAAIADWIVALLDAVGLERALLVGHSMGSLAALDAAARYPERVSGLALIGASVPMPVSDALLDAAENNEAKAMAMINAWSHSPRGLMGGNAVPGMWMFGANRRLMERQPRGVIGNDLAACNAYAGGAAAAAAVCAARCPALIVAGSRDLMTPARNTRLLAEMLPHARIATLPGAGHAMMTEQPDALLDALIGFSRG